MVIKYVGRCYKRKRKLLKNSNVKLIDDLSKYVPLITLISSIISVMIQTAFYYYNYCYYEYFGIDYSISYDGINLINQIYFLIISFIFVSCAIVFSNVFFGENIKTISKKNKKTISFFKKLNIYFLKLCVFLWLPFLGYCFVMIIDIIEKNFVLIQKHENFFRLDFINNNIFLFSHNNKFWICGLFLGFIYILFENKNRKKTLLKNIVISKMYNFFTGAVINFIFLILTVTTMFYYYNSIKLFVNIYIIIFGFFLLYYCCLNIFYEIKNCKDGKNILFLFLILLILIVTIFIIKKNSFDNANSKKEFKFVVSNVENELIENEDFSRFIPLLKRKIVKEKKYITIERENECQNKNKNEEGDAKINKVVLMETEKNYVVAPCYIYRDRLIIKTNLSTIIKKTDVDILKTKINTSDKQGNNKLKGFILIDKFEDLDSKYCDKK